MDGQCLSEHYDLLLRLSCFDSDIVEYMVKKVLVAAMICAAIAVTILLYTTTPATAGPVGVLALFVLTYIIILGIVTFGIYGISRVVVRFSGFMNTKRPLQVLSFRKSYYFASVSALGPVMLLGMQSVSGIGIYEFFLVAFFVVIGCIYINRRMA